MAECKSCGIEIPEGTLYCNECEARMKADESYLDSLLSSVVSSSVEPLQERPVKKTTAEPVQERPVKKEVVTPAEVYDTSVIDETDDEFVDDSEYSIFRDTDDSFLDNLFADDVTDESVSDDELVSQEAELLEELLKTVDNAGNESDMESIYADSAAYDDYFEQTADAVETPQESTETADDMLFDIYDDELDAEATLLGEVLAQEIFAEEEDPLLMFGTDAAMQETDDSVVPASDDMSDFWSIINEAEPNAEVSGVGVGAYDSLPELMQDDEQFDEIPNVLQESENDPSENVPKKKKSFWARVFGNIREELTEEEIEERKRIALEKFEEDEQRAADEAAQEKLNKEERAKRKEEEAAQKKAEKDILARKKADEKLLKAEQKRIQKDKKEQAKRALLAEIEENEGKINKFGASIIVVMFAAVLCFITIGTSYYNYKISIDKAQFDFDLQRYDDAYNDVYGLEIKEEDMELYDKIMTVQYVNVQLLSYMRYHSLDMDAEALDSLIKGLRRYEKFSQQGLELGITEDLNYLKSQIVEQLDTVFGIDEATAYEMLALESQEDYSVQIYEIVSKKN